MDVSGIDDVGFDSECKEQDSGFVDDIFENEEKGGKTERVVLGIDNAITMYGFSSIESRVEKKKQEREAKQKKEKKVGQMIMVDGVDELVIW